MPSERHGLHFQVKIDDVAVLHGLRAQQRELAQDLIRVTAVAARIEVLPTSIAMAKPTRLKRTLTAGSNKRGAFITSNAKGMNRRIMGLLNYGGFVTAPIFPVFARALIVAPGVYRGAVLTPRRYPAGRFLERSIELRLHAYLGRVADDMARIIQSRLIYAGTFGARSSSLAVAG